MWEEKGLLFEFSSQDKDHHPHDPHVHVWRGRAQAKFLLRAPVEAEWNSGLSSKDMRNAERIVSDRLDYMLGEWHAFFGG